MSQDYGQLIIASVRKCFELCERFVPGIRIDRGKCFDLEARSNDLTSLCDGTTVPQRYRLKHHIPKSSCFNRPRDDRTSTRIGRHLTEQFVLCSPADDVNGLHRHASEPARRQRGIRECLREGLDDASDVAGLARRGRDAVGGIPGVDPGRHIARSEEGRVVLAERSGLGRGALVVASRRGLVSLGG